MEGVAEVDKERTGIKEETSTDIKILRRSACDARRLREKQGTEE